ncbi:hypothetical protein HMN09_01022800 [Mycena chlorophos]|uniref:Uncharacterized protein n=1 Tax=Mycena chlorophos TaxID=658473 RepID=A0A8H6SGQ7_MYCCL|nr:hypothetical protein HMN09_01022800 [Mycena chlorophos]
MALRLRRVFRLVLASLFVSLYVLFRIKVQNTQAVVDELLDAIVQAHTPQTSHTSESFWRIQNELTAPKSPRDFRLQTDLVEQTCSLLRTKRVLLVGPQTTYYLHSLWLDALSAHDDKAHECSGIDHCRFHHICLPPGYATSQSRYKAPPKDEKLVSTNSSLMRYVLSTSLYTASSKNDAGYTEPIIDPRTGIRLKNAFWLHYARQSQVLLLNRGPIPAPKPTYAGNWSFLEDIPRYLRPGDSLIANAAFHATTTFFIPEVLHSLHQFGRENATVLWHPSWYNGFVARPFERISDDPWASYYNLQGKRISTCGTEFDLKFLTVYMQNYVLEKLLPLHGVYFLPRFGPARAPKDWESPGPKDGLRYPMESSNARAMVVSLLKSLVVVLDQA